MKAFFLINAIGIAAASINIEVSLGKKAEDLCPPSEVQSIVYELDWNDGPNGSGKNYYSLKGSCQCHNARCSEATCNAGDKLQDGEYLYCEQISGGDCGMSCAFIGGSKCPNEDAKCPGWATVPLKKPDGSVKKNKKKPEEDPLDLQRFDVPDVFPMLL
ncbi:hypothetical protein B0T10DRAFT_455233 [Thelonectria olida]|uniref:Uncharacterized protein n=1 Tax=Thelonectria olida TaxID=1576542 RepID=A0A9P8WH38_9HYPO|nr:hypothetical protein B0T10DRAFT_455233 [Thelonectria olida]